MDNNNLNNDFMNNGTDYINMDYMSPTNNTGAEYVASPEIQKTHRLRGILGAFGGALIGGIVWTIIGCLGYVSGYIAILIFVLAQAGYAKLSGKQETFGIIISLVFGLLMIIPATYCAFAFNVLKVLNEGIHSHFTYTEVLLDLPLYMERYGWWGTFWGNLAKGYLFTIIVAVFFAVDAFKKNK